MNFVPSQPYVAPWQTQFNRYSTQTIVLPNTGARVWSTVIPAIQWWRVISVFTSFGTDANAGDRQAVLTFESQDSLVIFQAVPPLAIPANSAARAVWLPNASYLGQMVRANLYTLVAGYPDVLWPGRTSITFSIASSFAGDDVSDGPTLLVENYTEDYNNETPGALVPAPLIT